MVLLGEAEAIGRLGLEYAIAPPPEGFASEQEKWVFYELFHRRIPFVYDYKPHDNPYTAQRDELQLDFVIPALHIVLNPRTPFTHPDPRKDIEQARDIRLLGYQVYYLDGLTVDNVDEKLDEIPGLGFVGQSPRKDTAKGKLRQYFQPSRNISFPGFGGFG